MIEDNCAHSISLAAGDESLKGGSLNGVVCAHVGGKQNKRHEKLKKK
ncbi:MAG: hypothetical protein PHW79_09170 [Candidatus Marinimicrobia bacterium]|nr:hypothetical protein [Candidatus Neomarinimicrobiota bacterium]